MMMKVKGWSKDGSIEFPELELPGKFEVCHDCHGEGRTLCDGLRDVAFSSDEMAEDPEFAEAYFRGDYDDECRSCGGKRVVAVPDEAMCKTKISWWKNLIRHENAIRIEQENAAEARMWARMEGGLLG